ncbi:hypothetical protein CEXT_199281 [Caerostris extrusa]|uniref:Uncharacterized protein n=1 Tax=Caerostris extrusa TaxID=172846 RepID=A0AAV4WT86_CAEEX|nr:hypothetical protein CEXT_199281 [Caerostris extrusa]
MSLAFIGHSGPRDGRGASNGNNNHGTNKAYALVLLDRTCHWNFKISTLLPLHSWFSFEFTFSPPFFGRRAIFPGAGQINIPMAFGKLELEFAFRLIFFSFGAAFSRFCLFLCFGTLRLMAVRDGINDHVNFSSIQ